MRPFLLVILVISCAAVGKAQGIRKDSSVLRSDSVRADTSRARKDTSSSAGIDTVVAYSCTDSIVYEMETKTMSMFRNSDIKFRQMQLKAERVDVNWNSSVLTSFGVLDTSTGKGQAADSSRAGDTATIGRKKYRGLPVMKDGSEDYHGFQLGYNFKTKKGKIDVGDTEIEKGYYHGEEIKKVDKDVLFVSDGRYTTCDDPDPHFYFYSPTMKVTMQDAVVAEPVVLYISDVPVFALPLGVFPNKAGRRSGIITPAYGEDPGRGRYLRHLGYYWAMSDYMDWNFRSDLYTKGGYSLYSDYRYNLRYLFNGALSGEYKDLTSGEPSDPVRSEEKSYRVSMLHNQDIDPTTHFNVNFTFASNNSYVNTIDIDQALQQSIISNATIAKSWEGSPNSMSVNVSRTQNLTDGSISEVLPSVSFNHSLSYPFRRSKSSDESSDLAWYEMIGLGYGATATNNTSKVDTKLTVTRTDTSGRDTSIVVDAFARNRSKTVSQNLNINVAPKLGHFTISPILTYTDNRAFADNDVPDTANGAVVFNSQKITSRNGTVSSGLGTSTRMYGIVQPNMLGIAAIRHTLTPSLSFTYQKQIVGENLPPKQMFTSLSVGNIFEMKTTALDSAKEAKKIQLMNIDAGLSYNFSADSLKFSQIGTTFRTAIGSLLNVGGGADFNLYEHVGGVDINKFLWSEEHRLARMTDFRLSLSTALAGAKSKTDKRKSSLDTTTTGRLASGTYGLYREEEPDFSIPWKLSLSWDFAENKVQPSHSSSMRGNLEFNLTEHWKFTMGGGYDFLNKHVEIPEIRIQRDLHCWLMDFSWVPTGPYRHFEFVLRVAAPQLSDVKLTKSGSERGIY